MIPSEISGSALAVTAHSLRRVFERRHRPPGIGAALRAFVKSEKSIKIAVQDLSFRIQSGACVGLVGANGAGKTTLLKMIAGLLHPSSGEIQVLGYKPFERKSDFLKLIGMVMGQRSQLWIDLPAQDSFDLLASLYDVPSEVYQKRLDDLTHTFQVKKLLGVQVRRLSLGERMKLEIIASLLHKPSLLILDEPTIGLDLIAKQTIRDFVQNLMKEKLTTVILSSHDMEDIVELGEQLMVMSNGVLRFNGTVEEFQARGPSFSSEMRRMISDEPT